MENLEHIYLYKNTCLNECYFYPGALVDRMVPDGEWAGLGETMHPVHLRQQVEDEAVKCSRRALSWSWNNEST